METQFYRMPTVGKNPRRMQSTPKIKKSRRGDSGDKPKNWKCCRDETGRDGTRSMLLPLHLALSVRYQLRLRLCIPLESELFFCIFLFKLFLFIKLWTGPPPPLHARGYLQSAEKKNRFNAQRALSRRNGNDNIATTWPRSPLCIRSPTHRVRVRESQSPVRVWGLLSFVYVWVLISASVVQATRCRAVPHYPVAPRDEREREREIRNESSRVRHRFYFIFFFFIYIFLYFPLVFCVLNRSCLFVCISSYSFVLSFKSKCSFFFLIYMWFI